MNNFDKLLAIPIGSLLTLSEQESDPYFNKVAVMPKRLKDLIISVNTGSFIRGLALTYKISSERIPIIAVQIVKIATGEKTLAQLPALLSTELKLANDKAQQMAGEIERDLFGALQGELEEGRHNKDTGARNVLDLKQAKRPPVPPPMPK